MQVIEKRKETRYTIPEIYQEWLTTKIMRNSGEFASVRLIDVSLRGIRIKYDFGLAVDSVIKCSISIPIYLTKEFLFSVKVIYCIEDKTDRGYLIGGEITQPDEHLWVKAFLRVHDFIDESLRTGKT